QFLGEIAGGDGLPHAFPRERHDEHALLPGPEHLLGDGLREPVPGHEKAHRAAKVAVYDLFLEEDELVLAALARPVLALHKHIDFLAREDGIARAVTDDDVDLLRFRTAIATGDGKARDAAEKLSHQLLERATFFGSALCRLDRAEERGERWGVDGAGRRGF